MQIWKIDENNIFTGESCFVEEPLNNEITTPIIIGFVKPKWNGVEWAEGATEQEILEWKNSQEAIVAEPTEIDLLKQENEKLQNQLASINSDLQGFMDFYFTTL